MKKLSIFALLLAGTLLFGCTSSVTAEEREAKFQLDRAQAWSEIELLASTNGTNETLAFQCSLPFVDEATPNFNNSQIRVPLMQLQTKEVVVPVNESASFWANVSNPFKEPFEVSFATQSKNFEVRPEQRLLTLRPLETVAVRVFVSGENDGVASVSACPTTPNACAGFTDTWNLKWLKSTVSLYDLKRGALYWWEERRKADERYHHDVNDRTSGSGAYSLMLQHVLEIKKTVCETQQVQVYFR